MQREERVIYLLLIFAGGLPVIGHIEKGGPIGAGITIAIAMVALGIIGLISDLWRERLPAATAKRRSR
ncbi:MAG: hypothetical protein QM831_03825 [Kofleriaceae bacterium]